MDINEMHNKYRDNRGAVHTVIEYRNDGRVLLLAPDQSRVVLSLATAALQGWVGL